jgi:hypothetical protein
MQPRITLGFLRRNYVRSGLAGGNKIRIINAQVRETNKNQNALLSLYESADFLLGKFLRLTIDVGKPQATTELASVKTKEPSVL